ncbi:amidohydrolase family protein [Pelagibacterium montanilacus]|uniref:amidohydrolase family protein n=1 Tax=Pelagibacterium montanilacus TaxID=2185280 RepID=UPI000F8F7396|nr:amidohydrolase family protein [Pelagibacterium montanilacus]
MDQTIKDHSVIDTRERGDSHNRYGPTAARDFPSEPRRLKSKTVDVHAHVFVKEAQDFVGPHIQAMDIPMMRYSNDETRGINRLQEQDRATAMVDVEDRIRVLDAMGIDVQVVAPPPPQCYYTVPLEIAVKGTQLVNDGMAAFAAARPDRLAAMGSVPLQGGQEAARELERCMTELGMKGVQVLTNVNGAELADPAFEPFWKKAEELGALVMIHPNGYTQGERFQDYYFSNVIGNPLDTSVALHHLIFSGTLERMPDLKILAVHGGGFLPAYSGRIDHAWGARKDSNAGLPKPPTHYLRKVYFDNVVFTPHQLEYLVKVFGADHIMLGTDYPYDMCDYDPVEHIVSSDLTDEQREMIAGGNARKLLGID